MAMADAALACDCVRSGERYDWWLSDLDPCPAFSYSLLSVF